MRAPLEDQPLLEPNSRSLHLSLGMPRPLTSLRLNLRHNLRHNLARSCCVWLRPKGVKLLLLKMQLSWLVVMPALWDLLLLCLSHHE